MASMVREGDRVLGRLLSVDGKGVVRMEERVEARIDDVWSALSDPERLARWLGEVEGDLRLGGEFRAHFHASGWQGTGVVEVCAPPRRLAVVTRDADDPSSRYDHALEIALTAEGDRTALVWEERGLPVDFLAPYGAGIQIHVEDLISYLSGGDRCDASARFEELLPAYRDLGASA